jgi:SOS-response transcriptional repressor LexA
VFEVLQHGWLTPEVAAKIMTRRRKDSDAVRSLGKHMKGEFALRVGQSARFDQGVETAIAILIEKDPDAAQGEVVAKRIADAAMEWG